MNMVPEATYHLVMIDAMQKLDSKELWKYTGQGLEKIDEKTSFLVKLLLQFKHLFIDSQKFKDQMALNYLRSHHEQMSVETFEPDALEMELFGKNNNDSQELTSKLLDLKARNFKVVTTDVNLNNLYLFQIEVAANKHGWLG